MCSGNCEGAAYSPACSISQDRQWSAASGRLPGAPTQEVATMQRIPLTSRDDVLSGFAHDLRTPLMAIRTSTL